MSSPRAATKTDRQMEDTMLAVSGDPERVGALAAARAFKRSWIELAEALHRVGDQGLWEGWGFKTFEAYCRIELHLKKATVAKLLGSYRFLESNAPRVLRRSPDDESAPVPSLEAVDFAMRADRRGAADEGTMRAIKSAVFEEGIEAPLLSRRFKEVAFPVERRNRDEELRAQIASTARRLAALLADEDSPVPRGPAAAVEEAIGQLLEAIEN